MIVAALCIAVGGVTFEKVDIPDLYVQRAMSLFDAQASNFRHADVDADGHMDLLLPTRVYRRPDGQFDPERFMPMPEVTSETRVDIWGNRLFFQSASSLAVYELVDGAWNQTLNIEHACRLQELHRLEPDEERPLIAFERFLHDVDSDGRPEILRVEDAGIAVSVLEDNGLESTHLDLYPPPRLSMFAGHETLWPQSERRISLPTRNAMFQVVLDGDAAVVVNRIRHQGGMFAFRVERYRISNDSENRFTLIPESTHQTEPLPRHVYLPIALNEDGIVDYFGYRRERLSYNNWKPFVRGYASTDGGKNVQIASTRGFSRRAMFTDLDGDGDKDWVGEESGLVSGGLRETANRALFQRKIRHTILARMQNDDGTFESRWRELGQFTMQFDKPPRHLTYRFWQYRTGHLTDFTADFNGDRWTDVLVCGEPGTVSLYLGGQNGFSDQVEASINVPRNAFPVAIDIDGDGRSDVVVLKDNSHAPLEIFLNVEDT